MRIKIRLFARLRDIAGAPELVREVPRGTTLRSVWQGLTQEYHDFERYSTLISGAVNDQYARMDALLEDGDEVAFLPPVSGG
jgi:sulfur-carrier protein